MQFRFSRPVKNSGWLLGLALAVTLLATPLLASGQSRASARISAARARRIALASHPGQVVSTRLTNRSGRAYYDVYVRSGEVRRHVLVNARTGGILARNTGPRTRDARRIALAAHPGEIVAGPTSLRYQGKTVKRVTVQSGVVRRTLLINTQTGNIVKTMIRNTD